MTAVAAPFAFGPAPRALEPAPPQHTGRALKVTIRPLARPPDLPLDFEDRAWASLQDAVRSIHGKGHLPANGSLEELYHLVEALCWNRCDARLAQRLQRECDKHVCEKLGDLANAVQAARGPELLQQVHQVWQDHCDATSSICALFAHLDRTYIVAQRGGASWSSASSNSPGTLYDCCIDLFRARLEGEKNLKEQMLTEFLDLVDGERRDSSASSAPLCSKESLMGNIAAMLVAVEFYNDVFEPALLERTTCFYQNESNELVSALSLAEYLAHCEQRLEQERQRCEMRLVSSSADKVLAVVRAELLQKPGTRLLDGGFLGLLTEHRLQDLDRLYRLFGAVDERVAVKKAWAHAIKHVGAEIMDKAQDSERSKEVIPALFDLRRRLLEIHYTAFELSSEMSIACKDSLESCLNVGAQNLPAKLLARYVDEFMRRDIPASAEDDVEATLERVIGIFRFISAKDGFEAFYKKDLTKRLLQQTSSSADSEARMVQKLRDECGSGYTSKIEGMFRDVELSKEFLVTFLQQPETRAELSTQDTAGAGAAQLDFGVTVVATGLWPTQPIPVEVVYPPNAKKLQDMYSSFYSAKFAGRSLRWTPAMGQCTLRAGFECGARKELVMSVFQAIVCLQFNNQAALTCKQIGESTQISQADLRRVLQSLAMHKHIKVLLKPSKSREVAEDDVFSVNKEFTHKLYRVVVPQIPAKDQQEEEAGVEQRVFEDRQHEVDAIVVRIMKANKTCSHADLLTEVFRAVTFPLQALQVKARIESLIEREYLVRNAELPSTYNYLA